MGKQFFIYIMGKADFYRTGDLYIGDDGKYTIRQGFFFQLRRHKFF